MASANFWDNSEAAQQVVGQLKSLKSIHDPWQDAHAASEDLDALIEMAEEDPEIDKEVVTEIQRLEERIEELELKSLLDGPHDGAGAILTVHARDGGTDANDWAEMLLRMYSQWAQKNSFSIALLDRNDN
ncbi:MAG: PCRF domain-containing protein, partial [Planctomycetaceae bacterium]|nr:PCRF domain-containing protein [Planctomycetaceae bacterium]